MIYRTWGFSTGMAFGEQTVAWSILVAMGVDVTKIMRQFEKDAFYT